MPYPSQTNQQTEDYTSLVLRTCGIPGQLHHGVRDDVGMWAGYMTLFELTGNGGLDSLE